MLLRAIPGSKGDKGAYYRKINTLLGADFNAVPCTLLSGGGHPCRAGMGCAGRGRGQLWAQATRVSLPRLGKPFPCREGKKEGGSSRGAGVAEGL